METSQSSGIWTLYSEKNLKLNSLYHLFPFLHCSWDSGVEERISWIRKPCKNTSVEHSEICLLNSWKYILCACANTSAGVAAAGVWEVGQKEITFMQSGCSHSFSQAFSKINILHRQIFPPHSLFLIKALLRRRRFKSHRRSSAHVRWRREPCWGRPQGSRRSWKCPPRILTLAPAVVSIFWGMMRWNWGKSDGQAMRDSGV